MLPRLPLPRAGIPRRWMAWTRVGLGTGEVGVRGLSVAAVGGHGMCRGVGTLSLAPTLAQQLRSTPPRPALPTQVRTLASLSSSRRAGLAISAPHARAFHASRPRQDIFFLSIPAVKSTLLSITRFSLLVLPFVWRYKLWRKYKRTSWLLIQIPIFAFCIVVALGLDQSPRTGRWRLLLMSENEELAWSYRKHKEVLKHDGPLILPPDDPRSQQVARVATRLVTALEEQDDHVVCGAAWPPREDLIQAVHDREDRFDRAQNWEPSAKAKSGFMPFRPLSQNPLKHQNIEASDWNIYLVELPQLNAFALPSKEIFMYTGLLDVMPQGSDELVAAVLAHEIAHVTQRHGVENMGFLNLAAVLFDVLRGISFAFTISFPIVTDSAGMFINWLNDVVAERAYSRKLEQEADLVGLELLARAGYDPRAMLDLWELMAAVEADAEAKGQRQAFEARFPLLRTHPTSDARQEAIAQQLPYAMALYQETSAPKRATIEKILAEKARQRTAEQERQEDNEAKAAEIQSQTPASVAPA